VEVMTQLVLAQHWMDDSFNIVIALALSGMGIISLFTLSYQPMDKVYKRWHSRHLTHTRTDHLAKLTEEVCTAHGMTLMGESYQAHPCTFTSDPLTMKCTLVLTLPHPFPIDVHAKLDPSYLGTDEEPWPPPCHATQGDDASRR
jgi:hypothetical protein